MKKILFTVGLIALSMTTQAQLGGLIKKAKKKAESAVENAATGDKDVVKSTKETVNGASSANVTMGGRNGTLQLFTEEVLDFPQYRNHIGEVCFSHQDFDRTIPETAYIKSFKLGEKVAARSWSAHSVANSIMLQLEEYGMSVSDINKGRNEIGEGAAVYVVMYLDGKLFMFTGNEPGTDFETNTKIPSDRFELNDGTSKEFFGEYLMQDLAKRTDLLTSGTHKLKFEVMPRLVSVQSGSDIQFKPLAVGEIDLVVPEVIPTAENCFPYKAISDPALEAEVLKLMKSRNPNAIKVIINTTIKIERMDNGTILNKNFIAAIVSKTSEKVWYDVYRFDKLYDGTQYGEVVISSNSDNFTYPRDWRINKECLKFLK
ncbi:hypothetical protein [Flavobacterium pallidum]|uniref:Uncharacterized protein n=1 Tax=Flavobacterium pallidum TaxID=2172098 RepID=A0A2S1SK28_9FLAO|nr:hypothetical protein [Flavobacterium pallidum]AWI26790.1 hypothetical protein HYN49_13280 [Flavobacterium pallidum]